MGMLNGCAIWNVCNCRANAITFSRLTSEPLRSSDWRSQTHIEQEQCVHSERDLEIAHSLQTPCELGCTMHKPIPDQWMAMAPRSSPERMNLVRQVPSSPGGLTNSWGWRWGSAARKDAKRGAAVIVMSPARACRRVP